MANQIEILRLEQKIPGVIEINGKLVTFQDGNIYDLPIEGESDLTDQEQKDVEQFLKALEK